MLVSIMFSVSCAVRKMISSSGRLSSMRSAALMPAVVVSISMSMRMTSQSVLSARASASAPEAAWPTTHMSSSAESVSQRSSRMMSKSSATRIFITCHVSLPGVSCRRSAAGG